MTRALRAVFALATTLALGLTAACTSSAQADRTRTAVTTTTAAAATTTTARLAPAGTTYGVGRRDITLVDRSRDTDADAKNHVAAKTGRTLPTVILYPTTDAADDATGDDHPVAEGRFPLVVFSHGVTASGPAYVGVMKQLVADGYVVALPTFPLTSGSHGWDNISQTIDQPADVSFIIGELLARSAGGDRLLGGHLAPGAVAIAGHSLGAITSLLFFNTCCRDERVKAVVAISGITFPGKTEGDSYDDPPKIPLLLLHGEKDTTLRYDAGSRQIFDETLTPVPRALVSFPDAGHIDVLGSPSFMPAVVAFLDRELRGDVAAWKRLGAKIDANGDARIEVAGGLPAPTT